MTSAECFRCEEPASELFGNNYLCDECISDGDAQDGQQGDNEDFDGHNHENPIDVTDITDEDRAAMLREYLEAYVAEFDEVPRLMPLDDEGKAPIIKGRCPLDSPEGRSHLVDGEEAIRQISEDGERGFAIYAGKWEHGTKDAAFVDVDDRETFPFEAFPETLTVLAGRGRGPHLTFRNAGNLSNAKGKGDVDGEIRAENWYCIVPGSVHPTGGVYHVLEDNDVAELADEDLPPELQPGSAVRRRGGDEPTAVDLDGEGEMPEESDLQDRLEAAFNNSYDGGRIENVYNGRYSAADFDDRSGAEFWLANRLDSWIGRGSQQVVERLMDDANLQKWTERTDRSYRDSILENVGYQEWYYNPEENDQIESSTDEPYCTHAIKECERPQRTAEPFNRKQRWANLQGKRFDEVLERDELVMWGDEAGTGKTTNAALGTLERDEPHIGYFDKHEKAREFVTATALPDDAEYYHLKGGAQKHKGRCMDADHAEEGCTIHGRPAECPSMCPIYDLETDHPTREVYEALVPEVGPNTAHQILELHDESEYPWHGGECAWQAQYSELEKVDYVAGVHPYLTQKSARDTGLNIIDETPSLHATERTLSVIDLTRIANTLERIADMKARDEPVKYTARNLAAFTRGVIDVLTDVDGPESIADLEGPTIIGNAYETHDAAAGHYVERDEPEEPWQLAEALARAKVDFGETVLGRMKRDEWEGTPVSIDPLLAAVADAGLETEPVMQAIAVPSVLEACPWCRSNIAYKNGAYACVSGECDWHEHNHTITQRDGERARATAHIDREPDEMPTGLSYRALPLPSQLPDPDETLVLDATATPEKVAALFDIDRDDVHVDGDGPLEIPNLHTTQILDGQYHAGTIADAVDRDATLVERIQATIDTAGQVHEKPLYVVKKALIPEFNFPENGEVLHYHATRGLNRDECDAVVLIGAPHPRIDECRRAAELLAMGRDDRVGGEEHSTRRDAPNPPVYRKLYYEDDDGKGRAVPTKHYTGLVGTLFRETREKELVQAVHRIRPLLADETKHAYLLTNVPTALPIDDLATFEELADPLEAMLPVPEGALRLLEVVDDVAAGEGPNGFRASQLVEQRDDGTLANKTKGYHRLARLTGLEVSERTVYNWITALKDVGLLSPEGYEQRRGVTYAVDSATLQSALSVLSSNGGFKVAAVQRFRSIVESADGSLAWLQWARDAFGLGGDRCEWDPPPDLTD